MPTNYTTLLGLALPTTGELSGTWGTTVNNSITELVEDAIAATATASVTSADWTLSTTGAGAVNEARCAILIPTGTPGVSRNINAPNASKAYIVINQSNAAVVIRGATGPTTGVSIAASAKALVAWTGSDFTVITDYPINLSSGSADITGTLAIANGGTGATTNTTARTNLGATTVGSNLFTLTNPSAITFPRFNADNTVSALDAATFRTAIGAGTGSGTVTSVGATSPVASSGGAAPTISLNAGYGDTLNPYASKTANNFLAAPSGSAGVPTFRAIVAADIPTLNQNTTGTASNVTGIVAVANGGTGVTTAQAEMNRVAGAVTSGSYLRGNGTNVVMSAIQAGDVPTLNQNTTGTASNVTGTVAIANGGTGATTNTAARTNLGATTVGSNLFTLTNPSAVTFIKVNADNTVSTETASTFRSSIGAAASGANTDITALDQDITITATGTIAADTIGYRGIPVNSQTAGYTLVLADASKFIRITTGGVAIPANGTTAFPIGSVITVYNDSASSQNITITTDTLRLAGTATTGTRAVAQRGIATLLKVNTTEWVASGVGVT